MCAAFVTLCGTPMEAACGIYGIGCVGGLIGVRVIECTVCE